jgi:chemotaxis protein histidine kinase CheA
MGKPVTRRQPTVFKSLKRTGISAGSAFALLTCLLALRHAALSQQSGGEVIDVEARSRDIVDHLNAVIQYYRASTQTIQKAGEPNDVVYRDQAVDESTQIAGFAFQSANAEAAMLKKYQVEHGAQTEGSGSEEQQRMQAAEANATKQIDDLKSRKEILEKQLATARPREIAGLEAEKQQLQEALDLAEAMKDALQKIVCSTRSRNCKARTGRPLLNSPCWTQHGPRASPVKARFYSSCLRRGILWIR